MDDDTAFLEAFGDLRPDDDIANKPTVKIPRPPDSGPCKIKQVPYMWYSDHADPGRTQGSDGGSDGTKQRGDAEPTDEFVRRCKARSDDAYMRGEWTEAEQWCGRGLAAAAGPGDHGGKSRVVNAITRRELEDTRARALLNLGRILDAIPVLENLASHGSNDLSSAALLADALVRVGRVPDAIRWHQKYLSVMNNAARTWVALGHCYSDLATPPPVAHHSATALCIAYTSAEASEVVANGASSEPRQHGAGRHDSTVAADGAVQTEGARRWGQECAACAEWYRGCAVLCWWRALRLLTSPRLLATGLTIRTPSASPPAAASALAAQTAAALSAALAKWFPWASVPEGAALPRAGVAAAADGRVHVNEEALLEFVREQWEQHVDGRARSAAHSEATGSAADDQDADAQTGGSVPAERPILGEASLEKEGGSGRTVGGVCGMGVGESFERNWFVQGRIRRIEHPSHLSTPDDPAPDSTDDSSLFDASRL